MPPSSFRRSTRRRDRSAVATVELAIILPVLFVMVFGTLEVCQRLLLKQAATVAAYETARSAARRTISTEQARERGISILEGRSIVNGTVIFQPGEIDQLAAGESFRVIVRVPNNGNTPVNYVLPTGGRIQVVAHMLRE